MRVSIVFASQNIRKEFWALEDAHIGLVGALTFQEEEAQWKTLLYAYCSLVGSLRAAARDAYDDQLMDEQLRDDINQNPILRYLWASRNNLAHYHEKGFMLPWGSSKGLYEIGGFGVQYDPMHSGLEHGNLCVKACKSDQLPFDAINIGVVPDLFGPRIEGVDGHFIQHTRPRMFLRPALDRNMNEVPVPEVEFPVKENATTTLLRPAECSEFAVGYLFGAIRSIGIPNVPTRILRESEVTGRQVK